MWNSVDTLSSQKSYSGVPNTPYTKPTNHLGAWRLEIPLSVTGLDASDNLTKHNYSKTERTTAPPINHQKKERKKTQPPHPILSSFFPSPSIVPHLTPMFLLTFHISKTYKDATNRLHLHKKGNSGGREKCASSAYVLID